MNIQKVLTPHRISISSFVLRAKFLFVFLLLTSGATSVLAGNYPANSDYLWVTRPNHADWLYQCGENASIEVEFFKYGVPTDGVVTYDIATDMLRPDKSGKITLKNGRGTINMGTKKTPGFRDLQLKIKIDGKTYSHHIKVGFSVDKIVPYTKEPSDFCNYWEQAVSEMRKYPLTYTKERAEEYCTDKIDCYLVKLQINRQGQSIYGYLFYPKDAKAGSCPAVMCPPGAGIKTIKQPLRHKYYAENGMLRFEIEIHGLDPRLPQSAFDDMSRAFNGRENGYLQNGIDNRDTYYMKRVYLACVKAMDLLRSLPEWDGKNLIVQGGSQGGALSIITAALDNEHVTQCIANHPALSDMAGYAEEGHTGGYPHFRDKEYLTKDRINTMAYYDVVNFAPYVKGDCYLTWGYNDVTCPPTTSYAVWNKLQCHKESLITPVNEHWTSDDTEYGQMEWAKRHLIKSSEGSESSESSEGSESSESSRNQDEAYIFTSFREPSVSGMQYLYSYDGLHWDSIPGIIMKPEIGNLTTYTNRFTGEEVTPTYCGTHVLRDPSIVQGPDGTFHLVWTTAWSGSRGFGYASSKDLIHWSKQREIPVMADSCTNNVWAPEVFYDDETGYFYIIWSSGIAPERYTAADKQGSNACHRPYYTKTKDFKTFTPAKQFYDCGFNSIDGFLVKRAKNDYVFVLKDNRKPGFSNLFCVFGTSPEGPFTNPTEPFAPHYSEGPCVVKLQDEWLIYFDQYRPEQQYCAYSTKDFKTFTPANDRISVPAGHKHGTIVKITKQQLNNILKAKKK